MTTTTKKPKAPKTLAEVYSKDVRDAAYARVVHLDPAKVHDNPWQPRAVIDPEDLKELAESIHAQGLLQPPVARFTEEFGDECQLAFGHRRVAAIRLQLKEGRWSGGIPVSVQELSDADMVLMALAENAKRKDLSILEEVKAYDKALAEVKGLKITNLAQSIGMSRSALSNQLRLLNLPDVALEHLGTGKLTPAAAREILVLATGVHRHDEEIEMVIEELQKSTSEGPWKVDHVRRQIIYVVAEHAGRKWRPMSKPGNADGWEDVERKAPAFDVSKFKEEHSDRVHKIPHRYERGSREWTCHGRKWDQLQKVATKGKEGEEEIQKLKTWSTLMKMVPVFEEALGESVPRETEDGVIELTDDQKLKLGTLAELAENTGAQWGQFVGQTANRQGFFSDPAECYERCIKGAQFGTNHQGQIRLFCFNKEHYEEKEALGQQEYMDSLKPEQEA